MDILESVKHALRALLASAQDPRVTYQGAADRQEELIEQVRKAQSGLGAARFRLEAHISAVRRGQLSHTDARSPDLVRQQLAGIVAEGIADLEAELILLDREQEELRRLENRLTMEQQLLIARQQAAEAHQVVSEARSRVHEQLGAAIVDLTRFGAAMDRAEETARSVEAKVAAVSQVADLAAIATGQEDPSKVLAARYAVAAGEENTAGTKRLLTQGFRSLIDLEAEFRQLRALVDSPDSSDLLIGGHVRALAAETYRQGVSVLADAFALIQSVRTGDRRYIHREAESGLSAESIPPSDAEVAGEVAELTAQAERCSAALRQTRHELTSTRTEGARRNAERTVSRLHEAIEQAKAIQTELHRLDL